MRWGPVGLGNPAVTHGEPPGPSAEHGQPVPKASSPRDAHPTPDCCPLLHCAGLLVIQCAANGSIPPPLPAATSRGDGLVHEILPRVDGRRGSTARGCRRSFRQDGDCSYPGGGEAAELLGSLSSCPDRALPLQPALGSLSSSVHSLLIPPPQADDCFVGSFRR